MRRNFFLVLVALLISTKAFSLEKAFTATGMSMQPTLEPGDSVIVDSEFGSISRGDLVAIGFKLARTPVVKRVVALSGDKIEIREGLISVNGEALRMINEKRWQSTTNQLKRYNWVVPENNIFVLGDNSQNSRDSRRLGLISTSQIKGKVVRIIRREE